MYFRLHNGEQALRYALYWGYERLISRVQQYRSGEKPSFTTRYKVHTLVYHEPFGDVMATIQREKTMKKWKRDWKINLIERENRHWCDLYPGPVGEVTSRA